MIIYQAYYFKDTIDENGKEKEESLGFKRFAFFPELGVTKESKAFMVANKHQVEATRITFNKVPRL